MLTMVVMAFMRIMLIMDLQIILTLVIMMMSQSRVSM